MVDGWNKGLDVLLIFVRSFVFTVFPYLDDMVGQFVLRRCDCLCSGIIELLQPDYARANAILTAHLLSTLSKG